MRSAYCLALALCCLAPPASAQAPAPTTPKCADILPRFSQIERSSTTKIEDIKNGCRLTDTALNFGPYTRWRVEQAELTGVGLFDAIAAGKLPEDVNLTLTGLRLSLDRGPETSRYIMEMQQTPFNAHLAYQWDDTAEVLSLDDISVSGAKIGLASVSARISGLKQMPQGEGTPDEMLAGAAIDSVTLTLNNYGVFQSMFLAPVIGLLPPEEDPRPAIARYQDMLAASIAGLPEATAKPETKTALTELVRQFPAPTGIYQLTIDAPKPIPLTTLTDTNPAAALGLISSLVLTATHQPPAPGR